MVWHGPAMRAFTPQLHNVDINPFETLAGDSIADAILLTMVAILAGGGAARIFGIAFVLALVMAVNLAAFLSGPETTVAWGTAAGALTGLGWVAPAIATVALFERRSVRYIAINGGYFAVAFVVMGAILGAWR